jgi:cell division protein FtsB
MNENKKQEKRKFPALLVICAAVIVSFTLSFFFGQSGIIRLRELNEEYERVLLENYKLALENKKSANEIKRLRHDPALVEKIAREELQYVSPQDTVLIVPEDPQ